MKLMQDNNWKAIHFDDRVILRADKTLYPQAMWERLVYELDVEPLPRAGHYRAITK